LGTIARSINELGAIAGYYTDASNVNHGFVRNLDGNNAIDALGFVERSSIASTRPETIAGYYSDSDGLPPCLRARRDRELFHTERPGRELRECRDDQGTLVVGVVAI
jgi:hypothetical protein